MSAPRISAIVSTYNSERFIEGCLENLMEQTVRDELEVLVIDSASPQGEGRIVRRFMTQYPQIRYWRTAKRETQYASWNRAIRLARGRYLTTANADDRSRKDAYEIMARELDRDKMVALVYTDWWWTTRANDSFEKASGSHRRLERAAEYSMHNLLQYNMIGPRPMYRRRVHGQVGYFDPKRVCVGDYEFWLRLAERHKMKRIPIPLALFYRNRQGLFFSDRERSRREAREICLEFFRRGARNLAKSFI